MTGVQLDGDATRELLDAAPEGDQAAAAEAYATQQFENALGGEGRSILPPMTVHLKGGRRVRSVELNAVIYTNLGVFITGFWDGEETKDNPEGPFPVIVMWDQVAFVQFDFELMRELLEEQSEKAD